MKSNEFVLVKGRAILNKTLKMLIWKRICANFLLFVQSNRVTICLVEIHALCTNLVDSITLTSELLISSVGLTYQKISFYNISGIAGTNWRYYLLHFFGPSFYKYMIQIQIFPSSLLFTSVPGTGYLLDTWSIIVFGSFEYPQHI